MSTRGLRLFDEAAGQLLDELLRVYRAWGRHRTACDLSTALEAARKQERTAIAEKLRTGWPCVVPGGDVYGPHLDALTMAAQALEDGGPE